MLLALGQIQLSVDRLRTLWPFAVVAVAGTVVFTWLYDAVADHDGITALDGPIATWFAPMPCCSSAAPVAKPTMCVRAPKFHCAKSLRP